MPHPIHYGALYLVSGAAVVNQLPAIYSAVDFVNSQLSVSNRDLGNLGYVCAKGKVNSYPLEPSAFTCFTPVRHFGYGLQGGFESLGVIFHLAHRGFYSAINQFKAKVHRVLAGRLRNLIHEALIHKRFDIVVGRSPWCSRYPRFYVVKVHLVVRHRAGGEIIFYRHIAAVEARGLQIPGSKIVAGIETGR